jgi:hypothetical protein
MEVDTLIGRSDRLTVGCNGFSDLRLLTPLTAIKKRFFCLLKTVLLLLKRSLTLLSVTLPCNVYSRFVRCMSTGRC